MDEDKIRQRMQAVVDAAVQDIGMIRTGRATPALVEDIVISAYGGQTKLRLQELATITALDPQTLLITPWDQSIIGEIKKGIEVANIGLNPVIAGEAIRINLPPLTAEDRENYIKLLSQKLENGRIQIRQVRHDAMEQVKEAYGAKELSEDEKVLQGKKVQEITDQYAYKIDEIGKRKETELRSI